MEKIFIFGSPKNQKMTRPAAPFSFFTDAFPWLMGDVVPVHDTTKNHCRRVACGLSPLDTSPEV
jgi:hypothetical protein